MARIQLKNLVKRWGQAVAVQRMSLDIADGEFLVLLGPSGCGKTTTMRMVAGLEEPSEGEVWIGERCVNELEPKDRDVAMVFQSYGLYPNMTVAENISFPLRIRGMSAAQIGPAVQQAAERAPARKRNERKDGYQRKKSRKKSRAATPGVARCARRVASSAVGGAGARRTPNAPTGCRSPPRRTRRTPSAGC